MGRKKIDREPPLDTKYLLNAIEYASPVFPLLAEHKKDDEDYLKVFDYLRHKYYPDEERYKTKIGEMIKAIGLPRSRFIRILNQIFVDLEHLNSYGTTDLEALGDELDWEDYPVMKIRKHVVQFLFYMWGWEYAGSYTTESPYIPRIGEEISIPFLIPRTKNIAQGTVFNIEHEIIKEVMETKVEVRTTYNYNPYTHFLASKEEHEDYFLGQEQEWKKRHIEDYYSTTWQVMKWHRERRGRKY